MMWRKLFGRRVKDADIDAEIRLHLAEAEQDRIERGEAPDLARRAARVEFGNVRATREDVRAVWTWTALEQLAADLRAGARILTRSPGLSATTVTLIALVIGGNATIFSIVHGLLTKPAAAIEAHRLVSLGWAADNQAVHPTDSYANYLDVAAQSRTVAPLLAFQVDRFTLTHPNGSYAIHGALVSSNYFETLALPLASGRGFTEDESRGASGLAAVISHRVWLRHFHGADDAVGQGIVLNGHPATIVGVAPPRFQGVWLTEISDVWVPIVAYSRAHGQMHALAERAGGPVAMLGRLPDGVSFRQAQTELATIAARLQAVYRDANKGKSILLFPYSATAAGDSVIAQRGPAFLAIFSVITALTLLIVCANAANLMLARAVARQREMAVRQSFGASRTRVVRLVLAEGIAISLAAWTAACLFAAAVTRILARIVPPSGPGGAAIAVDFSPDWKVLAYAMALAAAGTVIFTIAPAVRTWRQDLLPFLKAGEQGVVQGRSRLSNGLVVLQLAFSVLLLIGAGLAYRSFSLADALDLGFPRSGLLLVTVNMRGAASADTYVALLDRMRDRLRSVPGVVEAACARTPPKEFWSSDAVRIAGAEQPFMAEANSVGPGYLQVLGLAPVAGRVLTDRDRTRTGSAAMINANLAEALWPGQSAVGRSMLLGASRQPVEVVGVVPNAFFSGFRREDRPYFVFLPQRTDGTTVPAESTFYVRYAGSLEPLAPAIGRALAEVDARVPIVYMRTMETQLADITSMVRILATLLGTFAAGSLIIATIGQYAALAFAMRRRIRDFGVRLALGASAGQILASVMREGFRLTAIGLAIGFVLSLVTGRGLRSVLYGVTPTDAATYAGVFALLACASLMACYVPAYRAARTDPMRALRQE